MSSAENKTLASQILEEFFSQGNLSKTEEFFSPEIVIHDPDKELHGLEQVKQGLMRLRLAFPDLHYTAEDMLAEDDKVVIRFRGQGTQRGEFRGMPPTGKPMSYTGMMIMRFQEKKAVDYWGVSDVLGMLQQLGATLSFPHTG